LLISQVHILYNCTLYIPMF